MGAKTIACVLVHVKPSVELALPKNRRSSFFYRLDPSSRTPGSARSQVLDCTLISQHLFNNA